MRLQAPQLIWLALFFLGVGIAWARYGQPKADSYDMVDCLIAPAISLSLLYWGGFFG